MLLLKSLCSPDSTNLSKYVFWITLLFCAKCLCCLLPYHEDTFPIFPLNSVCMPASSPAVSKALRFPSAQPLSIKTKGSQGTFCYTATSHVIFFYYHRHTQALFSGALIFDYHLSHHFVCCLWGFCLSPKKLYFLQRTALTLEGCKKSD